MPRKPTVAIVGPGSLGSALAPALHEAGYKIAEVIGRERSISKLVAKSLAQQVRAQLRTFEDAKLDASVVWICVPDDAISSVARQLAARGQWKGKIALHSSGARPSSELDSLKRHGALIGSAHPMMTFVRGAKAKWQGISFALEGDPAAVAFGIKVARDLRMHPFSISSANKILYHAVGSFCSPLVVALLHQAGQIARTARIPQGERANIMRPILLKTLENYFAKGAAAAFSGPIHRGDLATVRRHLQELKRVKGAREIYVALTAHAAEHLPVKNRRALKKLLRTRAMS